MSWLFIQSETLTSMADAIRQAGRTSETMNPTEMPDKISAIQTDSITVAPMAYMGSNIITFSSNAVYILNNAFNGCTQLQLIDLPMVSYIGNYAFQNCSLLSTVGLPMAEYIGINAFTSCSSLQSINLPTASYIGSQAFNRCSSLQSVSLPNVNYIDYRGFYNCVKLQEVRLSKTNYIGSQTFFRCYGLLKLYLTNTYVCSLAASNAFESTPIAGRTTSTGGIYGSIYVPASLYQNYKTATNWTIYSSRFVSI